MVRDERSVVRDERSVVREERSVEVKGQYLTPVVL